ncbi:MAG TPA: HAD-IA family hydrolase [Terriglobales bacterium]|nr:HAD-IA family hydrolase [Terriglobales bacterium]
MGPAPRRARNWQSCFWGTCLPTRTIIFDLGQTLVPFSFERLRPRLEPCRAQASALVSQLETGELDAARFQRELGRLAGLAPEAFLPWWNSIFELRWLVPPELLRELLEQYRVGLLSNTNALHFAFLEQAFPLLGELDFRIVSHQVGAAKPAERIYAAAEAAAGCAPEEILYFDDIAEYVAAARRRGWQAEVFAGADAVRRHLGR